MMKGGGTFGTREGVAFFSNGNFPVQSCLRIFVLLSLSLVQAKWIKGSQLSAISSLKHVLKYGSKPFLGVNV